MSAVRPLVEAELDQPIPAPIRAFAEHLTSLFPSAQAVLFYGSILRTGDLSGVLDFYVLTERPPRGLRGVATRILWPDVSYHELEHDLGHGGVTLRAKVASMTLSRFAQAVKGRGIDTTLWTRFVQPSGLVWAVDAAARETVVEAVRRAARTAARFATALGPEEGAPEAYWTALFQETYAAEFRVEKSGREASILAFDPGHYQRLLPACWADDGRVDGEGRPVPEMSAIERKRLKAAWRLRRNLGKPLNVARLVKAAFTFQGAARYAAWKIERHTGFKVELTPWRERHPVLAAPGVLLRLWKWRRARGG
ncbi:hypothetical protein DMC25_03305 [Caulobacter sp. D4A]|uniref:hypothetical protein n=1 Tax=unclassified Caulobacter TaxID=2648921 RepID=UPI000D7291AF|nr:MULTISPECIES: hypothetical protein [unclassified Caulobacter]PXA93193.1 hypothetical protein DMC18_09345 [Caulobacter sp. D5]PXA93663.1 hypothetical protein DMC25_03305 [Caulobacter sp. D4A]